MSEERERPNRTVNDFHSKEDLEAAMLSVDFKRSSQDSRSVSFMDPSLQEQRFVGSPDVAGSSVDMKDLDPSLDWILDKYDEDTTEVQSLSEELRRLQVLKSYLILDSERQEAFERVTGLASRIFNCPMALISLVDLGRQWFMSNRGLGDARETKRKDAFCAHAIMGKEDFLIVPDATKDFRFKDNPLVTGPPHIRFYAGAPLISPEGYKLGTLCVLDRKARPQGLTLEEKQNLMELAALAVQATVDHRRNKVSEYRDPAQMIAYTAHDLLTPLTGVQLSLSLLMEDEEFRSKLSPQHREMIHTASSCTDVMVKICQTAIDSFRHRGKASTSRHQQKADGPKQLSIAISDFVKSLSMVLDPFPKQVPMIITVHPSVPEAIVTDDLKVFRAAVNFLTNACAKTENGSVHLSIYLKTECNGSRQVVFECEDTGPGIPVEKYPLLFRPYKDESEEADEDTSCLKPSADGGFAAISQIHMPNSGLGLYSVAVNVSSMGGQYGFRPRGDGELQPDGKRMTGSIFWFSIPLVLPEQENHQGTAPILNNLGASMRSLQDDDDYTPGQLIRILSTPSLSPDTASIVVDSFTKVLEGNPPDGNAAAFQAVKINDAAAGTEIPKPPLAVPIKPGDKRQKRALVIEDSLVVRKSLTRVLTKLGFECARAVDGMEGLKELKNSLFDVVLCDFLMPVMDGLDCVQQYREWEAAHRSWFRQHIIGISAHASENDIAKGREIGMDDYKPKPVTYKQLDELLKSEVLKVVGERLDEIAAERVVMSDGNGKGGHSVHATNCQVGSTESTSDCIVDPNDVSSSNSAIHFCLIAAEEETSDTLSAEKAAENKGWKTVVVHSGEDALRLLKMRNWDAVLLDENLPMLGSSQCIARFREWEEKNRVTRQRNVLLASPSRVSFACGSKSMVQLPFGFNRSLGKPVRVKELEDIFGQAERSENDFGVRDMVLR
jgi:CheY-like chemotaxis protein/signal transduction histidine kinase